MAARQLWIEYQIHPGTAAQATALQAQYPNGIQMAPAAAAILFGTPITIGGGAVPSPPRIDLPAMSVSSPIDPTVLNYNKSNDIHQVGPSSWAGTAFNSFWGLSAYGPVGQADDTSAIVTWVGYFLWAAPAATVPPTVEKIQTRRFACGFEMPRGGEGATGTGLNHMSRDASRTSDGKGFAYRNTVNEGVTFAPKISGVLQRSEWDRIYIRPRVYSAGGQDDTFLYWFDTLEGVVACHLHLDSTGHLTFYNQGSSQSYPGTLLCTSTVALALNTWYRIDVLIQWPPSSPGSGSVQVFVNGVSVMSGSVSTVVGTGLGVVALIQNVTVGAPGSATPHGLEIDVDDWVNANIPALFTGADWTNGSHVALVRATGFGVGHSANWVGDWRTLQVNPQAGETATNVLTASIASSPIVITTDYQDQQIGCASLNVSYMQLTGGSVTGQLGYQINGTPTLAAQAVTDTAFVNVFKQAGGTLTPPLLFPLNLEWVKDAAGAAATAQVLQGTAEYLGAWGPEDTPPIPIAPHISNLHNAPYPTSGAGQAVSNPFAPVAVNAGVYTGNNLGQDVLLTVPAHWWWVRSLSSNTPGVVWWSSLMAAHGKSVSLQSGDRVSRANDGPLPSIGVAGPAAEANALASTYQWVAVSDPGMRFMLNGAFSHKAGLASAVNPLVDATFLPDGVFFYWEDMLASTTTASWFKGPGNATDHACQLNTGDVATVATVAAGVITSESAIHTSEPQTGFSAWRKNDTTVGGAVDVLTYTGNGAGGTRNIAVALGGGSPLFAIVAPHNGQAWVRDPSHAGAHSSGIDNSDSTTAIVGGDINVLQVGSTLNANNVVYEVFVLAGPANTGAWSGNPSSPFFPVLPIERPATTPPTFPATPTPTPPPSPSSGCIPLSQALVEIGVRLGDPTWVHWTLAEVQRYLFEALRTWNALTQTYRDQGSFSAANPNTFFDLPTVLPTLRGYNLKDQDLVLDLQYALLEPPSATSWVGTAQFTLADLTQAINRRRDQFLRETGIVLVRETTAITSAANGRLTMPKDIIEVRRAAWITGGGVVVPLSREDEWGLSKYRRAWQTAADPIQTWPLVYSTAVEKPFVVQLAPPPNANGTLETLAVVVGAILNPTTGVLLGIPDDWAWVVKFGALGDLLSMPGPNLDATRAAYCEARWQQGVRMAAKASVVLNGQISSVQCPIASVVDADRYLRSWETTPGVPIQVLTMGQNLVALSPPPDINGPYTVTLDVVRNAPVPVLVTDCFFEGGVSALEAIYNYAVHLAQFKEGVGQMQASMDLLNQFFRAAGVTIELDLVQSPDRDAIMGQSNQDERVVKRIGEPGLKGADVAGTEPRN